jgi:hypothetical protein
MRKVGYLISVVGLLLVFTMKIGQAHRGAGGCREYGPISVTSGCKTSAIEPRFASRAPRPDADHQISISGVLSCMLSTTEGDDGSGPASRSAVRSSRTNDVLVRYRESSGKERLHDCDD